MEHLKETQYQVQITSGTGSGQTEISKVVNAPDEETAIQMVRDLYPQLDDSTEISVTKANPGAGTNNKPNTQPTAKPNPLGEGFDPVRFEYPYVMVLPHAFMDVIPDQIVEGVSTSTEHDHYRVQISSPDSMSEFVNVLTQRTKTPGVSYVVEGIMESYRHV